MRSLILLVFFAGISLAWEEVSTDVEVDTPRGRLRGRHDNLGANRSDFYYGEADIFLGIPYAHQERFKKPVPTCKYTENGETLVAQEYGPSCYQVGTSCLSGTKVPMSEDCLTLNVLTPNVTSTYKYPVMMWIHGGAFITGCAQTVNYDGAITNLVNRGVVVVTIQYRLSALGFFTTLTDDFPANLGMHDQVEAIRWIKDQIAYFGGDPYRITIFGHSAGSASVNAHTYSPLSQDLFQQAIMQSGVTLTCLEGSLGETDLSKKRAEELCKVSASDFDNGKWDKMTECMMNLDPKELVKLDPIGSVEGWKMSAGDDFLPDIPNHLAPFRNNIPVMIGNAHDEMATVDMGLVESGVMHLDNYSSRFFELEMDFLGRFLTDRKQDMINILEDVYAGVGASDDDHELWMRAGIATLTAAGFTSFIQRDFQDYLANGNKRMWLYEMTYPKAIGRPYDLPGFPEAVWHGAEYAYLWKQKGDFDKAEASGYANQDDYDLAEWYGQTWSNFAKYGQPSLNDEWTTIPSTGPEICMNINGPKPVLNSGYRTTDNIIWNQVLVALTGDFFPPQFNSSAITKEKFDNIKSSASSQMCSANGNTVQSTEATSTLTSILTTTFPHVDTTTSHSSMYLGWNSLNMAFLPLILSLICH